VQFSKVLLKWDTAHRAFIGAKIKKNYRSTGRALFLPTVCLICYDKKPFEKQNFNLNLCFGDGQLHLHRAKAVVTGRPQFQSNAPFWTGFPPISLKWIKLLFSTPKAYFSAVCHFRFQPIPFALHCEKT